MKRKITKKKAIRKARKDSNVYPKGWNARSVKALADHYDNQSEEDAVAEDEAAYRSTVVTMMAIPVDLVPQVQKLLAKRAG
ncbi:MAG TPA: hypothetical protein VNT79_00480 [Phycisphaerae bacterium]|nr:hypothetical protein [Phycisphaerae bacterium]